jgi:hypothetical protein
MNRRTREASQKSPFLSYATHPLVLCLHLSAIDNPKFPPLRGSAFPMLR